jgi:hypothetical protein
MPNLALRNFRSWKLAKKWDFRNFLDQFWDFILKGAPKINNQMKSDVETILIIVTRYIKQIFFVNKSNDSKK